MKVAGLGCRRQATLASLMDVLTRIQSEHGAPDALASSISKCGSSSMQQLAQTLGLPLLSITAQTLAMQETHTQSARQQALFGTGSLAEAAALAAAGPGASLLMRRIVSADGLATAALAVAIPVEPVLQVSKHTAATRTHQTMNQTTSRNTYKP